MGVPLPDLTHNWISLCVEGILLPGHNVPTFLRNLKLSNFDPIANIISTGNLCKYAPLLLLQALAAAHPDQEVWLQKYYEETNSIKNMCTFTRLPSVNIVP